MSKMQAKVNIHESLIKKIKVGQKAEIRIESFPGIVFAGTVTKVSQLADSTRPWLSGGVKQDPTTIELNSLLGQDLKPGMTAEAKVMVGELDNVLLVPVQAIAEHLGEFYAFLDLPGGIERRKVKIGESNETHVQILEGLKEGDLVTLDARTRATAEFKLEEGKKGPDESNPKDKGTGAAPTAPAG
jgi:multidrug efflux pump subunit AcrA (membrane-fusion protein)